MSHDVIGSMQRFGLGLEHQIFHARVGSMLARLAEQHQQHDSLGLFDVDLCTVQGEQSIDDQLAPHTVPYADVLQVHDVAAAVEVQARFHDC
jgi:hypothetical protein